MHEYRVVESWSEKRLCVLRCSMGRYHVARALNVAPQAEMSLAGEQPHLGFDILLCTVSGAIFRVIFESINDGELRSGPGFTPGQAAASNHVGGAAGVGGD